jgi:hypothetical protein
LGEECFPFLNQEREKKKRVVRGKSMVSKEKPYKKINKYRRLQDKKITAAVALSAVAAASSLVTMVVLAYIAVTLAGVLPMVQDAKKDVDSMSSAAIHMRSIADSAEALWEATAGNITASVARMESDINSTTSAMMYDVLQIRGALYNITRAIAMLKEYDVGYTGLPAKRGV